MDKEKPKATVICAYMALIVAGLIYLFINCYAGCKAEDYGMTTNELRAEINWIIFYFIVATVIFIAGSCLPISPYIKIMVGIAAFSIATFLADNQIGTSKCLASVKNEFAVATAQDCHLVSRGEMRCGEKVAAVIEKRNRILDELGMKMISGEGGWKRRTPYPGIIEYNRSSIYIPKWL
ncbi:MAG: hypothetical protein WC457_03610 [Patescibacteria group bacterium]